jgi:O-methyltransferase
MANYADITIHNTLSPWFGDEEFTRWHRMTDGYTLVDGYRCWELYQMVKETANVPGDILEVGVWRGGTGLILAAAAQKLAPNKMVWLADTFTGVVKAGDKDTVYTGGEHADTSFETASELIRKTGVGNYCFLNGIFPEETAATIDIVTNKISLCHIDVDVYQSGLDIVNWLKPRMYPGAIIVFDDYGCVNCVGITTLVDELRETGEWIYIYNVNGHGILIKR